MTHAMPSYTDFFIDLQFEALLLIAWRFTAAVVFSEKTVECLGARQFFSRKMLYGSIWSIQKRCQMRGSLGANVCV